MSITPQDPDPREGARDDARSSEPLGDGPREVDPQWAGLTPGELRDRFAEQISAPERLAAIDRMVQGAHEKLDRLADSANDGLLRAQRGVVHARDVWQAQARHLCETQAEWTEGVRSSVRSRPLTAIGTAVVLGALVAELIRRR